MPKLQLKGLREFITHEPPKSWQDWRLWEAKELPLRTVQGLELLCYL